VLPIITPHVSLYPGDAGNPLGRFLQVQHDLKELDVEMVHPAHEHSFPNLRQRVDEILEHHRRRLEEMVAALSDHPLSPWDLAPRVHWDVGPWEEMDAPTRVLAVRETLAHLQLLESRGQVAMVVSDGLHLYKLTNPSPE